MVGTVEYTFDNVQGNHTISAEFEVDPTPPTPTPIGGLKAYYKQNGVWIPLFTTNQ